MKKMENKMSFRIFAAVGLCIVFTGIHGTPVICGGSGSVKEIPDEVQNSTPGQPVQWDTPQSVPLPKKAWQKTFGGTELDWGWSVQQTCDGGFIIAGETVSYGAGYYDAWLIKTDASGNKEWDKTFGGSMKDGARSVRQTADGGYIMAGYADSYGYPGHDFWLIKTDSFGNYEWDSIFGGPSTDAGYSVKETLDGGFIITGYVTSYGEGGYDIWLIKTDSTGNEEWSRTFGGEDAEYGMCVNLATDGGYIITGFTASLGAGGTDLWLVKVDASGNEEWNRTFGGAADDWGGCVCQTSDGGYIITGDTHSFGPGGYDIWLIKTDCDGYEEWNRIYGGADTDDTGYAVQQTCDGAYIVAGTQTSLNTGDTNIWFIETDQEGYLLRDMTFGGVNDDWAYAIEQTRDGDLVITGCTDSYGAGNRDVWLLRVDAEEANDPPDAPGIRGPSRGIACAEYEYFFNALDPNGDDLTYCIDWGDGSPLEWTGSYSSGCEGGATHRWFRAGLYPVRVKARDLCDFAGDWSVPRCVRIRVVGSKYMEEPFNSPDFQFEKDMNAGIP